MPGNSRVRFAEEDKRAGRHSSDLMMGEEGLGVEDLAAPIKSVEVRGSLSESESVSVSVRSTFLVVVSPSPFLLPRGGCGIWGLWSALCIVSGPWQLPLHEGVVVVHVFFLSPL